MAADPRILHLRSDSPEATRRLGERIGRFLSAGDIVLLRGELGAGKTCLVRGVARAMGIDPDDVNSPTYVLVNEYAAPLGRPHLAHMDAYRLHSPEDLDALGLEQSTRGAVLIVEWAERVASGLAPPTLEIDLRHDGEDRREITLRASDPAWAERLADLN